MFERENSAWKIQVRSELSEAEKSELFLKTKRGKITS